MPPVLSLLDRYPQYKTDFYESEEKIYCKKKNAESSETLNQQDLITLQTQVTDKQEINIDLIKAFTKADIPLEKVEKLKPFLQKYCTN
ncbi:34879_t:CDS:2, partial [Racocetra persica]